jgi:hypothetical protein
VQQNGYALRYAGLGLKEDRALVLEAVRRHGRALEHAGPRLKEDRALVLEAVRRHGRALEHAVPGLKEQTETMSEEEQDEGTCRASELAAIRSVLISASTMASRQRSDEVIMQLLDDALHEFDELGLVEVDSSEEDYDWGSGSDGGESDEEFARDLQKTLSAERRTAQQPLH